MLRTRYGPQGLVSELTNLSYFGLGAVSAIAPDAFFVTDIGLLIGHSQSASSTA